MIPEFTFKSKRLQPGPSISLKCMAGGRPEPKISWKFNGKNLTKDNKYVLREKKMAIGSVKSILVIKNVRSFDGGEYMCTASNEVGFVSFSETIDVYGPPLVHDMNNVTVAAGEDINIKCYTSGYPISSIEWIKEADPFYQSFANRVSRNKNLRINGTTEEDEGYYTCKSENGRGLSSDKRVFLNVIKKPEITPLAIPPTIMKAHSSYSIVCNIMSGDQPIKLYWLKDNDDISLVQKVYVTNTKKRYSLLQIQELSAVHSGVYSCVAENDAGKSVESVEIKISSPPRWLVQPTNIAASLNSEIMLDCMAEGFPQPQIKWYKYKNSMYLNYLFNDEFISFIFTQTIKVRFIQYITFDYNPSKKWRDVQMLSIKRWNGSGKSDYVGNKRYPTKRPTTVMKSKILEKIVRLDDASMSTNEAERTKNSASDQSSKQEIKKNMNLAESKSKEDKLDLKTLLIFVLPAIAVFVLLILLIVTLTAYLCTKKSNQKHRSGSLKMEYSGIDTLNRSGNWKKQDDGMGSMARRYGRLERPLPIAENTSDPTYLIKINMKFQIFTVTVLQNVISSDITGPIFITEPKPLSGFLNTQGAQLDCSAHGVPDPKIQWMRQNGLDELQPQTVNSGEQIELKCIVNGHPVLELIWKLNGRSLFDNESVKISKDILVISSANREHEGMYQCMVRNTWESIQTAAQVILGDMAPTFIQTFKSKKLQPGPSISLKCVSVGRPTPKITWNLNGKRLHNNNKFVLRETQMHNGTVVSSVVVKSIRSVDGGEYSCTAINKVDSVTHFKMLNIYGPPMVHDMDNITVAVGEVAVVKCYVSGYPISSIKWNKDLIFKTAKDIKGAAGPSSLDADGWRRILTSAAFGTKGRDLCDALARMTKKICSKRYCGEDGSLEALLACKLIPLDKNPGLRPIGVGEVLRRIMGRVVMQSFKKEIMLSAGNLQLCAGQRAGCKAVAHAMKEIFDEDECDAVLLVDADNAFNRINRKVMLHNICLVCPVIATYVINCYHVNARLFITGGTEITSQEGTTQGDPAAMPVYALATVPLLETLSTYDTKQAAYADDLVSAGKLKSLLAWWVGLLRVAPKAGYYPKPSKSWLIVKPEKYELAKMIFKNTNINITSQGQRHLGAAIGSVEFRKSFVQDKVNDWMHQLRILSKIACYYPQAAYCAFTAGFRQKFNYTLRTIPDIREYLHPIEEVIRHTFIPAICENRSCSDDERELLSLPVKMGGLGIPDITRTADLEHQASRSITHRLTMKIVHQNDPQDTFELEPLSTNITNKSEYHNQLIDSLREKMTPHELKANEIACSDGASIWLSSLPLKSEHFNLTKREFFDGIFLRYAWSLKHLPSECICKAKYSVDHALSFKIGGFVTLRHNEIRDLTADMLSTVCKDVHKEPCLQNVDNGVELRADVSARGFWQRMQRAFLDVRVFYPFAPSNRNQSLAASFRSMETVKKRKYNQRVINDENGTFTPLIFSSNGETKQILKKQKRILSNERVLRIPNVAEKNEGYYTCKAGNGRGLQSHKKLYINVIRKPQIARIYAPHNALKLGSTFSRLCSISNGDQPMNIYWLKDGLDASQITKVDVTNTKTYALLQVHDIGIEHKGNYTCVAENKAGKTYNSIKIDVAFSPKWTVQPTDVKVKLNSYGVFLKCEAEGFPSPTVKWHKHTYEGIIELLPFENKNIKHFENGTIKFSRIEANMEGNYSCLVSNGIEPDLIKLIKLKIIGFLEVMELTIQWKRSEGNIPKNSPRFTLLEKQDNLKHMSILKISRPINGEKFTCVASTKDFSEQKSILLSVEDVSVEESISTKAVEALFTQPPSAHVTKIIKLLGTKNSKKSGKLREQGDSSVALNDPILPKTLDHETPVNEENRNHLKVAGSRSKSNKTDLKTLLLFVLPAVAVFVLLILLIITLIAYLVTKRSNQRRKTENRRAECSGIDTLNKSHGKKSYSNMESLDRRYGKLERPLPTPGEDSEDNYQNPYEIPDYYAGMKSYSTLQHSGKHQPQTNSMPRMTVLQKAACSDITGPIFIKEPKPLAGFLNTQGAQLDCSAHGVPDPKIQWMRQNGLDELQPVKAVPPLMRIFSNGSMVIYDFDADQYRQDIHSTVYRCLASNIHGKIISSPVSVKATTKQQQQQLQAQVYDEYVIPGNTGVLTCHIPPFYKDDLEVVSWIREDNLIIKPKLKKNGLRMAENGQLLIENVSRNTNFKLGFWCQIRNRLTGETFLSQSAGRIKVTDNQGGVPPTISHISETVSINMGQEAELTCAGQGYPPPTYEWRLNSNEKILSESSTLEVDDFSESGTFVYSCILENKFGSDERKSRLIVREPLKAYILPNIQTVNSGDKIELKCVVNGHPVVELIWKFNGKSLFDSEKVKVLKNILVIPSANREHEGMYQCMVRNTWESIQTAAQVILGDMAPTFIQTFKSKKLQPGPSISLKCVSVGRPTPKITWNLHGKSLQNDNKFILREKQMHNGTVVSSVVVKNIRAVDGGEYSCIATNKVDSVTHSNTLDIYGPPMVHDMDNITVAVGENANVKCYVSGYPISSITWSKEIQQNYRKRGRKISNERILKIIKVNENDEGFYSCKATNGRGLNSKKRLYINVIRKPEIAQIYAPKKPSKIGSTFTKVCSVIDGDQPINIYWLKDGLDASLTGKVDVTNTKTYALLQIHEIEMEHSGNYTCVAENKAGKTHDSIKVNVAYGDTELLPFENKNIKHFENGTIKITRVGENMEGNYSCLVSNGIKPDLMQFIKLKSIDPLKIYLVQLNEVNDTVRIECNVIGSNDVHIQWKHSKRFIPKNSSQRFTLTEKKDDLNHISILKIISPINGEKFTCVASTKNFSGQKSILLSVDGVIVEEMLSTKAVEAFYTQSPSIQVTKIMKPLDKNSKKSGKLQEQGDSSVALNGPILRKKPDYGPPAKEDIKTRLKVAESRSKTNNTDLKTLLLFVLPAVAVFVLLILLIVTLIAYLVTKRSNQRHETENRRAECSGIDTLNKSHGKKCYSNMESLDRRYGKLERPVPIPGEDSEDNYQNPYEIPDYSVLPKAFGSDITGPIFIKEPQSLPGFLNTHGAQLDCSAHGVPDPKVQWMRQNGMDELQPVKAVPPLMSIFANGSMIIYDFDADQYRQDIHSTVYRCLASNIHGKIISSPVSVKATTKQQQQQLQAQVYDEYVIPGNTGVLTCHIPPFYKDDLEVVSWIREDNLIIHPKLKKNGLRMAENGQLLIENVSRNTNVKLGFWCQIRNRLTGETFLSQSAGRIKVTDNQGGVPPTISHISETVSINMGQEAELTCAGQGYPPPTYAWKLNSNGKILSESPTLDIEDFSDSGTFVYSCIVANKFGSDERKSRLIVREPLKAYVLPNVQTVNSGDKIELKCVVNGHPVLELIWKFNGRSLFESEKKQMHNGTVVSSVVVKNIRAVDGGEYSCIATNKVDSVTHSNTLDIYGPPMVHDMDNITVAVGENANVKCYVSGYPISSITWSKEIQQIYRKRGRKISNERILKMPNVNEKDEGFYSCKATNGRGLNSKKRLYINVIRKPEIAGILTLRKPTKVGSTFTRVCSVIDGDQPINIYWLKDGLDASRTEKVDVTNTKTYALLQIHEIGTEHSGNYTCVAENKAGKTRDSIKVNVAFSPKWTVKPSDLKAKVDSDVILKCGAEGFPSPTIKWFRHTYDGDTELLPFKNRNIIHFENGTIRITRVGENVEGNYSCLVSNGIEPDLIQLIKLKIIDPLKISLVQLNEVNDTVRIECKVIGGNGVHIQWKHSKRIIPKNSHRYTLTEKGDDVKHMSILKIIRPINGEKFTCVASTKNFSEQKSILLSVEGVIVEGKNSKKSGKLREQGDSSVALNGPILRKKPDYGPPAKEDIKNQLKVAGSRSKASNTDLKTLLLFVLPAVAVFVLLILLIVTLIAYLVTKRSNQKHETENRRAECSGIDTLNKSHGKKSYSNMESLDRRYGKLERPLPIPGEDSEDNYQNPYEIPDYYFLHGTLGAQITGPIFIKEPKSKVEFLNNDGAVIDCLAHGVPDPEISWHRQNGIEELVQVENIQSFLDIYRNGSLVIHRFANDRYRQDIHAAVYRCVASNKHGRIISHAVSVKATTEQQQQQLQAQVYDEYVISGNTAVLTCHIPLFYKDDLKIVAWIREDNLVIKPDEPKNGLEMTRNGKLLTHDVSSESSIDLGYWCQVKNKLTGDAFLSQSAGKIKITGHQGGVPPTISHISETISIEVGESVELSCVGQGYPPPVYTWRTRSTNKIASRRSKLQIENLSEAGTFTYACKVENKFGIDESQVAVIVRSLTTVSSSPVQIEQNPIGSHDDHIRLMTLICYDMKQKLNSYNFMLELGVACGQPLEAHISPNVQTVNSGDGIHLECNVNGHPIEEVTWRHNGRLINGNDGAKSPNNQLIIKSAKRENEGMYQCFIKNSWESIQTAAQVKLGDMAPTFTETFQSKKLQPGPSISLKCVALGRPSPTITWKINGKDIMGNTKYVLREQQMDNGTTVSRIVVKNMRSQDGGEYECTASNKVDSVSYFQDINVYGPPVVHDIGNITVKSGRKHPLLVTCIQYYLFMVGLSATKPAPPLQFSDCCEESVCHDSRDVETSESNADTTTTTVGLPRPHKSHVLSPLPPCHRKVLPAKSPYFNSSAVYFLVDQPMTLTWLKNGKDATMTEKVDVQTTKTYSLLQIHEVNAKHTGNYTCVAENKAGKTVKSIFLKIASSPKWLVEPHDVTQPLNTGVLVHCKAEAYPIPEVKWFRHTNEQVTELLPFVEEHIKHFKNGSIKIDALNKGTEGNYSCMVSNGIEPDLMKLVSLNIIEPLKMTVKQLDNNGNKTTIECRAYREDVKLQWSKSNRIIPDRSKRFLTKIRKSGQQIMSTLTINNPKNGETFKCTALTEGGAGGEVASSCCCRQGDESAKEPKSPHLKKSNIEIELNEESNSKMQPAESASSGTRTDLKTLLFFVLPAVAVFVLLILLIITLAAYLVTRKTNHRRREDSIKRSSVNGKTADINMMSMDRRYGKLERPLPISETSSEANYQNTYEIPDYFSAISKELTGPKFIKEPPRDLEFLASDGGHMDCMGQGNPDPKIRWYQGKQLSVHRIGKMIMTIENVERSDNLNSGFWCQVKHKLSAETFLSQTSGKVIATESGGHIPPVITLISQTVNTQLGNSAQLICVARGFPPPKYQWKSGRETISTASVYIVDYIKEPGTYRFTCVAENAYGSDTSQTILVVKGNFNYPTPNVFKSKYGAKTCFVY
ncbi:Down syndrome cell adhesion molecule-like protein Dscam2 [Nymphon striatum]|nr:Down syndrome cell adhesion molecule-like protein Dscam2 [Nymphon striatum]